MQSATPPKKSLYQQLGEETKEGDVEGPGASDEPRSLSTRFWHNFWDAQPHRCWGLFGAIVFTTLVVCFVGNYYFEQRYYEFGSRKLLDENFGEKEGRRSPKALWRAERAFGEDTVFTDDPSVVFRRSSHGEGRLVVQPREATPDLWLNLADIDHRIESGLVDADDADELRAQLERPGGVENVRHTQRLNISRCNGATPTDCSWEGSLTVPVPQLFSGRISTRGLFSLRHGKLELRLRLPVGDGLSCSVRLAEAETQLPRSWWARLSTARTEAPWPAREHVGIIEAHTAGAQDDAADRERGGPDIESSFQCRGAADGDEFFRGSKMVPQDDVGFVIVGIERRPGYMRTYARHLDGSSHTLLEWPCKRGPACASPRSTEDGHRLPFDADMYLVVSVDADEAKKLSNETATTRTRPLEIDSIHAWGPRGLA